MSIRNKRPSIERNIRRAKIRSKGIAPPDAIEHIVQIVEIKDLNLRRHIGKRFIYAELVELAYRRDSTTTHSEATRQALIRAEKQLLEELFEIRRSYVSNRDVGARLVDRIMERRRFYTLRSNIERIAAFFNHNPELVSVNKEAAEAVKSIRNIMQRMVL